MTTPKHGEMTDHGLLLDQILEAEQKHTALLREINEKLPIALERARQEGWKAGMEEAAGMFDVDSWPTGEGDCQASALPMRDVAKIIRARVNEGK